MPSLSENGSDFAFNTVVQYISSITSKNPNTIAVVCKDEFLTYLDLDLKAEDLAAKLLKIYPKMASPGMVVALCLERSISMFIALLAVLKTGATYVPIDVNYPVERIHFMLEDSASLVLLTDLICYERLGSELPSNLQIFIVDGQANQPIEMGGSLSGTPKLCSSKNDLCYVIYTSGTTGRPKGVMVSHKSVINYFHNVSQYLADLERIDFSSSFAFDLSVTTTLVPLMCGKTIVIYPDKLSDITSYSQHLQSENVDFIKSTPSYLAQVFRESNTLKIKRCFVGGEKLTRNQLDIISAHVDELYDEYGPTEATVGVLLQRKDHTTFPVAQLGQPYKNSYVYALDKEMQHIPVGGRGELYIGGDALAVGYLNHEELTKACFINDPFGTGRLYKTGDIVERLPDGSFEYINREDTQVKVRGFRVEIGEIEQVLLSYPGIELAHVLAREHEGVLQLHGFYQSDATIDYQTIRSFLEKQLPEYMLPITLNHMKTFPITVNGKVDYAILCHQLENKQEFDYSCYTQTQCFVLQLIGDLLSLTQPISLVDNFFALGGHSLIMTTLIHKIKQKYNCFISPREIYRSETLEDLAVLIDAKAQLYSEAPQ